MSKATSKATTPTPGGVEEIHDPASQDSAAGAVLSPPAEAQGGRADELSDSDLGHQALDAHAAVSELLSSVSELAARERRVLTPLVSSAREFVGRLEAMLPFLDHTGKQASGVQESAETRVETLPVVETGGQDVQTGAEISAAAVVHDENGNEVDR